MCLFLGSYLVNERTGSPLLVQLIGASFFFPMFVGGVIGGVISDRLDRVRVIMTSLASLAVLAIVMSVIVATGNLATWMLYPFILAVGIGGVIDFTSRRTLIYEVVGPQRATNALALESMALSGGNMFGALLGGAIIQYLGIGATFLIVGIAYCGAFLLMIAARIAPRAPAPPSPTSAIADLRAGFSLLGTNAPLVSILAVTVIFNLFYFAFVPLVPVFAEQLEVGAFLAGLLASAPGTGMLLGTLLVASSTPAHRGKVFVAGTVLAFAGLFLFAAAPWYILALGIIFAAGIGQAGFATMQAVLTMDAADDETRGRAMGLLSMAIGSLPIGMLILGGSAAMLGPATAVMVSCIVGLAAMALVVRWRPESLKMR